MIFIRSLNAFDFATSIRRRGNKGGRECGSNGGGAVLIRLCDRIDLLYVKSKFSFHSSDLKGEFKYWVK